jgi:hypothetical protein
LSASSSICLDHQAQLSLDSGTCDVYGGDETRDYVQLVHAGNKLKVYKGELPKPINKPVSRSAQYNYRKRLAEAHAIEEPRIGPFQVVFTISRSNCILLSSSSFFTTFTSAKSSGSQLSLSSLRREQAPMSSMLKCFKVGLFQEGYPRRVEVSLPRTKPFTTTNGGCYFRVSLLSSSLFSHALHEEDNDDLLIAVTTAIMMTLTMVKVRTYFDGGGGEGFGLVGGGGQGTGRG